MQGSLSLSDTNANAVYNKSLRASTVYAGCKFYSDAVTLLTILLISNVQVLGIRSFLWTEEFRKGTSHRYVNTTLLSFSLKRSSKSELGIVKPSLECFMD